MRRFFSNLVPRGRHLALAAAFLLTCATCAFSAPKQEKEPPKEPVYALEYGVVIFVPLIALALVFRPGRRTDLEDEIKLPFGPKQ